MPDFSAALILLLRQGAILALLWVAAQGLTPRSWGGLRLVAGLAIWGQLLTLLALTGLLQPLCVAPVLALALWRWRPARPSRLHLGLVTLLLPLVYLASFPARAFDEIMYHLPFVRAFSEAEGLAFLPDLRFPAFATLHEILCVPAYWLGGAEAAHLVSVVETLAFLSLAWSWAEGYRKGAGWLAVGFLWGSPNLLELSQILYVDVAITAFITAALYSLDQRRYGLCGLFLGTAFSVKYTALYFLGMACLFAMRHSPKILAGFSLAAAPCLAWLVGVTGNPVFPFATGVFGYNEWTAIYPSIPLNERLWRFIRLPWDVTFDTDRVNWQEPITPWLLPLLALLVYNQRRPQVRALLLLWVLYLAIFTGLPQDSRYLAPLLPALGVAGAVLAPRRRFLTLLLMAPGLLYLARGLWRNPSLPATDRQREQLYTAQFPEYRGLRAAGDHPVYLYRAERMLALAPPGSVGDHFGPLRFERIVDSAPDTQTLARNLRQIGIFRLLVNNHIFPAHSRPLWQPPRNNGGMVLEYHDESTQLWRIESEDGTRQ